MPSISNQRNGASGSAAGSGGKPPMGQARENTNDGLGPGFIITHIFLVCIACIISDPAMKMILLGLPYVLNVLGIWNLS